MLTTNQFDTALILGCCMASDAMRPWSGMVCAVFLILALLILARLAVSTPKQSTPTKETETCRT
jgi:hypothetical protein